MLPVNASTALALLPTEGHRMTIAILALCIATGTVVGRALSRAMGVAA